MSDLGTYAEGFNAFRRMMAAVPETSRLEIFQNAANEAARYVQGASRGCRQRSVVPSLWTSVRNFTPDLRIARIAACAERQTQHCAPTGNSG